MNRTRTGFGVGILSLSVLVAATIKAEGLSAANDRFSLFDPAWDEFVSVPPSYGEHDGIADPQAHGSFGSSAMTQWDPSLELWGLMQSTGYAAASDSLYAGDAFLIT